MKTKPGKRICKNGHSFTKSSACPVCPFCEKAKINPYSFMENLSAPAKRALINNNITTIQQLGKFSVKELLSLHGIGPASIPKLKQALASVNLNFKT